MFPLLNDAIAFGAHVLVKPEIVELCSLPGTMVGYNYNLNTGDTFSDSLFRECRGIVFDRASGQVICRPLHKFFNVAERADTQVNVIPWDQVDCIMDKRDGSMITTVVINRATGEFDVKSKRSFTSDVANAARNFINLPENQHYRDFCSAMVKANKTAIFEWTSPKARIVLSYPIDELVLLHVRCNLTGEYVSRQQIMNDPDYALIPKVKTYPVDELVGKDLQAYFDTTEGVEGVVFMLKSGEMFKLKTNWYVERHRVMTFLRVRDIASAVLDESVDDIKAALTQAGADISPIVEIEKAVTSELLEMYHYITTQAKRLVGLDNHAAYLVVKDDVYCKLILQVYRNPEFDLAKACNAFYVQYYLKARWNLDCVQLVDSIAEGEEE